VNTVDGPATQAATYEPATYEPVDYDPVAQADGLEHWLQDLRTSLADDPPDWIDANPAGMGPAIALPETTSTPIVLGDDGIQPAAATPLDTVGRHRAPD
jgi:hypothetical protein